MNKNKNLIPDLRFPEFKEREEWIIEKLGVLTNTTIGEFVIKTKQDPSSNYPVYNGGKSYTGFYDEYNNEANKIVISARGANAGFVNLIKQKYWAGNSCYSVEVLNNDQLDLELLFYYIKHNQIRFTGNQQAANIPSVSKGDVEKFNICYPKDILEQKKIAECLTSLDNLINVENEKLDKLKEHKNGLMQNLFPQEGEKEPKVRFKEFEKDGEWKKMKLGEVAPLQRGFDLPVDNIIDGDYPVVFSNGILKHHNKFKVKGPGVVTGRSGTIGKVTYVEKDFWPHNTSLWVTDFCNNDPLFIYYYYVLIGLEQFSAGGGIPTLNRNDVHLHKIAVPNSIQEQKKIAGCLISIDNLIKLQSEKIEQLKLHKKGLMQGLFPRMEE